MAGISDEDKNKVRAASDLVAIASDHMALRQRGRDFWGCCPFHGEKTPSLKIDPSTQLWHCFGCNQGGDVFTFVMKIEDIEFPDAVRQLARRAGIQLSEEPGAQVARGYKARLKEVCARTAEFYHEQLMRGKGSANDAARRYLGSRGLNGAIPKAWNLGFAPGNRALVEHLKSKGFKDPELIDANVAVKGRSGAVQDRFFNRVMFPISDIEGSTIAFGGRVVGKGEPKYLNSQETPIFHKSEVLYALDKAKASMASTGTAIIVEGYTDVIALHEAGITNAVATLGTALTVQHLRSLSRHAKNRIVYLFDGDAAGQRAADRALQFIDDSLLPESGRKPIELSAVTLPDDLDPADFIAVHGADALRSLIGDAQPLIRYGIDRRLEGLGSDDFEAKGRALMDAVNVLAPIKHSILAHEYAAYIADRLHVDLQLVLDKLSQTKVRSVPDSESSSRRVESDGAYGQHGALSSAYGPADTQQGGEPRRSAGSLSPKERERLRIEREFLVLCSRNPEVCLSYAAPLAATSWHRRLHARIAQALLEVFAEHPDSSPAETVAEVERRCPHASSTLTCALSDDGAPAEELARFLSEELAIRDMEQNIIDMNGQLKSGSIPLEDREFMHQSIAMLQSELTHLRLAHQGLR